MDSEFIKGLVQELDRDSAQFVESARARRNPQLMLEAVENRRLLLEACARVLLMLAELNREHGRLDQMLDALVAASPECFERIMERRRYRHLERNYMDSGMLPPKRPVLSKS